jgi:hypothetical protein
MASIHASSDSWSREVTALSAVRVTTSDAACRAPSRPTSLRHYEHLAKPDPKPSPCPRAAQLMGGADSIVGFRLAALFSVSHEVTWPGNAATGGYGRGWTSAW